MPTHLSGLDGFLIFVGLILAVALVISGWLKDAESEAICRECPECTHRKQQRSRDKAEARVQGFIRDGICPKCRWALRDNHCESCGKDWR